MRPSRTRNGIGTSLHRSIARWPSGWTIHSSARPASLDGIIASKRAANRAKDRESLLRLEAIASCLRDHRRQFQAFETLPRQCRRRAGPQPAARDAMAVTAYLFRFKGAHGRMIRTILQVVAFFCPPPVNLWVHRIAGARVGAHARLHPCVLILAKEVRIGSGACVRFGTFIQVRSFRIGSKSKIGYFTLAKGLADLHIGDACVIGPRVLFNCERPVTLDYFVGIGTGSMLYTHGCFLPVTEGFRTSFGPIHVESKCWVSMNCTIGPGVTIHERSSVMPGTVVLTDIEPGMIASSRDIRLRVIPQIPHPRLDQGLEAIARSILADYSAWSGEFAGRPAPFDGTMLRLRTGRRTCEVTVDGGGDIVLLTREGAARPGMYFNLADLTTDPGRDPVKLAFEEYLGRNHGLIFLSPAVRAAIPAPRKEAGPSKSAAPK